MRCLLPIPSLMIHDAIQLRGIPILDTNGNVPTIPVPICTRVATNDYGFVDANRLLFWSNRHHDEVCMHADALRTWLTTSLRVLQNAHPPTGHTPNTTRLHPHGPSAGGVPGTCGSSARCESLCGHDAPE